LLFVGQILLYAAHNLLLRRKILQKKRACLEQIEVNKKARILDAFS
jgi:hypothetical protein